MLQRGLCVLLFATFLISTSSATAQMPAAGSYTPTLTLDVISVRESQPNPQGFAVGGEFSGNTGSLNLTNMDIFNMLTMAYGLARYQLADVPDWTRQVRYNVQAKADEATETKLAALTKEQVALEHRHMMQVMLTERFHLKTHWETRQQPTLHLMIAKGGPRLSPGGSMPISSDDAKNYASRSVPEVHQRGNGQRGYELIGHKAHTASLARFIGFVEGMETVDATGLTGTYDFDLQYSQHSDAQREADTNLWPPMSDAVHDQLGLTLEHTKGPVQVLVVDHVEPPSQN